MKNFDEFRFNPTSLSAPRKPGISAYMRIKNGGEFVRLAILSHLDYYDEIITCHNDCSDNTEEILHDLKRQYPQKIKTYHYLPKVHPLYSAEHNNAPADSVHSMANYSNYVLSKTTFSIVVKLDDDHLAIAQNLVPLTNVIRTDIAAGRQKIYTFSGINLIREKDVIQVVQQKKILFSGNGDIMYHPVNEKTFYHQGKRHEIFNLPSKKQMEQQYMGIMYFHLKYLKEDLGLKNLPEPARLTHLKKLNSEGWTLPFSEFRSIRYREQLVKQLDLKNRIRYTAYKGKTMRKALYKLTGYHPHLKAMRLIRLPDDLKHLNFERDVLNHLGDYVGA